MNRRHHVFGLCAVYNTTNCARLYAKQIKQMECLYNTICTYTTSIQYVPAHNTYSCHYLFHSIRFYFVLSEPRLPGVALCNCIKYERFDDFPAFYHYVF